jgi:hypothetical protein
MRPKRAVPAHLTNVRQANGRPAVGTTLDAQGRRRPALLAGSRFFGHTEILGQTFLTIYEPTDRLKRHRDGRHRGSRAAGSMAATTREIVRGLSSWMILSLGVGLSVTVAALWWLLRPLAPGDACPVGHGAQGFRPWNCRQSGARMKWDASPRPWPSCGTTSPKRAHGRRRGKTGGRTRTPAPRAGARRR